jgi:hypothetical protein
VALVFEAVVEQATALVVARAVVVAAAFAASAFVAVAVAAVVGAIAGSAVDSKLAAAPAQVVVPSRRAAERTPRNTIPYTLHSRKQNSHRPQRVTHEAHCNANASGRRRISCCTSCSDNALLLSRTCVHHSYTSSISWISYFNFATSFFFSL